MTKPKEKQPRKWMTDHALELIVTQSSGRDVLLASMLIDERRLVDRMSDRIKRLSRENKRLRQPIVMKVVSSDLPISQ